MRTSRTIKPGAWVTYGLYLTRVHAMDIAAEQSAFQGYRTKVRPHRDSKGRSVGLWEIVWSDR